MLSPLNDEAIKAKGILVTKSRRSTGFGTSASTKDVGAQHTAGPDLRGRIEGTSPWCISSSIVEIGGSALSRTTQRPTRNMT